jgi:glycosyltransferase involved in cell wall biosynthesis/LmbE family N-acetylglucosaminyl deacetylase
MTLTTEAAYLPSLPEKLPEGSWLILAPHPDDETFGMGGTLLLAQKAKIQVDVLFLTDGSAADSTIPDLVKIREKEAKNACQKLGVQTVFFWGEKDRELRVSPSLIQKLGEILSHNTYGSVFFPSPQEPHPDHRVTAVLAWESLRQLDFIATPISYDISVQGYTNQLIDISQEIREKEKIMACYPSQLSGNSYIPRILGLNQARAWSLPLSVSHAEAFYRWPKENRPLNAILLSIATEQASLDALPADLPLVSVITRTQNRPEFLREAIRSVASQTYPNIELIVVNDGGENCTTIVTEESIGSIQHVHYEYLEEKKGRAHAANIGLKKSQGAFLIFLDDDDYFLPEHLDKLVTAISTQSGVKVVYTGIQCIDENKALLATQFATPFNPIRLLYNNFIPIHAALFSQALVQQGCQFDETFDLYEDWDFWLQASMQTPFLFIEGISAHYRITQTSGFGVNADNKIAEKASLVLFKKWLPTLKDEQLIHLMGRAGEYDSQATKIQRLEGEVQQKNQIIFDKETHIQNQTTQLTEQAQQLSHQRQRLSTHVEKIEHQDQELLIQRHQIKIQRHDAMTLEETVANLNNDLAGVNDNLILKRQETEALYQSTSWMIMKPLRVLKDLYLHVGKTLNREPLPPTPEPETTVLWDRQDYTAWIERYDTLDDIQRKRIEKNSQNFSWKPLISVVMPTYNSPLNYLEKAIISVQNQLYPHWELCIADDASEDFALPRLLQFYAEKDSRIKIVLRPKNGHISNASNSALELATGEFVALLDHDDVLSEQALFWVVDALNNNPEAALIYSDEDKLSEHDGHRQNPYFKPDWNPELFLSQNMISHLGVYKTKIMKQIGGFRVGFEGSQDYDLALRFIEKINPNQIIHIPKILYHWRIVNGSAAKNIDTKPYASIAAEKAVNEHFERCGIRANAKKEAFGHRIYFELPDQEPLVSIIIPTRNAKKLVQTCVESLYTLTTYQNFEVILVDNGSNEAESLSYFSQLEAAHSNFRILRDKRPFNYSAQNNLAISHVKGELIALLNNDIEIISPDWLSEMVSIALQKGVGAVGAKLLYPQNTIQHAGVILGMGGCAGHSHHQLSSSLPGYFGRASLTQSMSAVTAACLVVKREIFLETKGFNEKELTIAFNDVDLCLQFLELGYRNVYTPFALLYHHESATRGLDDSPEKQARFMKETRYIQKNWPKILENDPAYNVNLTLNHTDFSFAWPPRKIIV